MNKSQKKTLKKFTSFDLFAGAGGLSHGFSLAGIESTYALEQDKWAGETYAKNNPNVKLEIRDIRDIADEEIARIGVQFPDVIVGGPPCQGFSHANTANKDSKDPRNSLFREFIRFVKVIRPPLCVIENVPGLLRTKLVNGTMAIDAIHDAFSEIGYGTSWKILNAVDFGVPQRRDRLFIIGMRRELGFTSFPWPEATHQSSDGLMQIDLFDSPNGSGNSQVSLWDAISDLPQIYATEWHEGLSYPKAPTNAYQAQMRKFASELVFNHEPMRHTARITERFESIGHGQSEADVPEHLRPRRRGGNGELSGIVYDQNSRRQHPSTPCNAMVASSHTNFIHPHLNRNFTVREMMRIQSFPDHYVVCGKRAVLSKKLSIKKGYTDDVYLDQRAQIGNAVPPLLAQAVGLAVGNLLTNNCEERLHAA